MTQELFSYPEQARVGRLVPKSKIYQHGRVSTAVRQRFVSQVDQIIWQYKLAPETINLTASKSVPEIQIFDIILKTEKLDEQVLRAIDRAMPLPIIFQLHYQFSHGQKVRVVATYKRPSEADAEKSVIDGYFSTAWQSAKLERQPLPVALSLRALYEQLLAHLLPHPLKKGESLKAGVKRLEQVASLQKQLSQCRNRLQREKQFNRKVGINAELRDLQNQISTLLD